MARIEVLNPVASSAEFKVEPAKRLGTLEGKTIGLYWNMKSGGELALAHIGRRLRERYPSIRLKSWTGEVGTTMRHATNEQLDAIGRECDAVVGTSAD